MFKRLFGKGGGGPHRASRSEFPDDPTRAVHKTAVRNLKEFGEKSLIESEIVCLQVFKFDSQFSGGGIDGYLANEDEPADWEACAKALAVMGEPKIAAVFSRAVAYCRDFNAENDPADRDQAAEDTYIAAVRKLDDELNAAGMGEFESRLHRYLERAYPWAG